MSPNPIVKYDSQSQRECVVAATFRTVTVPSAGSSLSTAVVRRLDKERDRQGIDTASWCARLGIDHMTWIHLKAGDPRVTLSVELVAKALEVLGKKLPWPLGD
jgi:hypothetical protein